MVGHVVVGGRKCSICSGKDHNRRGCPAYLLQSLSVALLEEGGNRVSRKRGRYACGNCGEM